MYQHSKAIGSSFFSPNSSLRKLKAEEEDINNSFGVSFSSIQKSTLRVH
jgi:hypothetical protein